MILRNSWELENILGDLNSSLLKHTAYKISEMLKGSYKFLMEDHDHW